eukprot:CAMPEP_0172568278 /NCGR_PEP_ID=MMETSP1067-20121228/119258_1 /TAXON_ID=265564 ORGANISM="Thalassiosira punctigera, Strain Tpunct2005C2" /NCGR_SAMPLE_ID=MMETSP1067 /ASSEMBLY_ACC=CAM_ASM_000444 /LENGTH=236 /DNA_ID=CAMNT_0013359841 /DNA_START=35 /DNA_END=746 /DNA_ORIENTATION=+
MAKPSGQSTHTKDGQSMGNSQEDYPTRSSQRPPRPSRPQTDALEEVPDESSDNQQRSSRSGGPQHQKLTPDSEDFCFFDIFYRVIFSIVHLALSTVLSPVLSKERMQPKNNESLQPLLPKRMDDPELAMPDTDNQSVVSSSSFQPILKTETRRCNDLSAEKKSVRFPAPEDRAPHWAGLVYLPLLSVAHPCLLDRYRRRIVNLAQVVGGDEINLRKIPNLLVDGQDLLLEDFQVRG